MPAEKTVYRLVEVQGTGGGEKDFLSDVPDFIDRKGLANLLGVTPKTIDREIRRGLLRCVHIGRSVRFTKKQVLEYLEAIEYGYGA